jgi:lipopolysaccharide transport system ATP-binding protein
MSDLAITVQNVSKAYRIWARPASRLTAPAMENLAGMLPAKPAARMRDRARSRYRDFWALKDISFELRKGEAVGIIGRNGSGKSTLLQIIAGTMQPTAGAVHVNGRVAALLELGSGFNYEFTGRENIFLNGAVLGLSRKEMEARFDAIAAFADIGDFLDQPVKTYSSGMVVRVAFAVSVCLQPDLLIVDEALSVGDIFFQQKCFKRIHELIDAGTSLLFVSHDTAAVQNLCDRAILLVSGSQVYTGPPEEAVSRYYAISSGKATVTAKDKVEQELEPSGERQHALAERKAAIMDHNILPTARSRHGVHELEVLAACFVNEHGLHSMSVEMLKTVQIHLLLRANREIPDPSAGLHLYDRMNNVVFAAGTRQLRTAMHPFRPGEERILIFKLSLTVQPGLYTFSLGCAEPSLDGPNHGFIQDRHEGLGPIEVHHSANETWPFYGIAQLPLRIEVHG